MAWNDKNMIGSSGGGGVDLPVGTIAYFPDGVGQADWLVAGEYPVASYPDLADLPGYPILDTVQNINDAINTRVPMPSSTGGSLAFSSQSGDRVVIANAGCYVESTANDPSGLTETAGDYFVTGSMNLFQSSRNASLNKFNGLSYVTRGFSTDQDIYSFDITARTYQIAWSSSIIGNPNPLIMPSSSAGSQFDFTDDNRIIVYLADDVVDNIFLWISNAGDFDNGTLVPCTLPIDRTSSLGSWMKGVGVSGDKVVISFENTSGSVFYQYDRTNDVWTDITTNTTLPIGVGIAVGCSGHSMSDNTVALYSYDDNEISITSLKGGNVFAPVQKIIDPNTSVDLRFVFPVVNGNNMWFIGNSSSDASPRISYDDLGSFQQLSAGDASEFNSCCYAPQIENIAFSSESGEFEGNFYNSLTLQAGTNFLVPVIREVTASSNPVHLAKVNP